MSNNKYKILVVEDDRNILSMIQTVLETNGYQVLTAQRRHRPADRGFLPALRDAR